MEEEEKETRIENKQEGWWKDGKSHGGITNQLISRAHRF
jgi:hypothetical protein